MSSLMPHTSKVKPGSLTIMPVGQMIPRASGDSTDQGQSGVGRFSGEGWSHGVCLQAGDGVFWHGVSEDKGWGPGALALGNLATSAGPP